jgi:hypothetical protein
METSETMLQNFIKKYGKTGLKRLAMYFTLRQSNEVIGAEFNVTRQRVHQWQQAFTETHTTLKPFVEEVISGRKGK